MFREKFMHILYLQASSVLIIFLLNIVFSKDVDM